MTDKEMKNQMELKQDYQNRNKEYETKIDGLEIKLNDRLKEITNQKGQIADKDSLIENYKLDLQNLEKQLHDRTTEIMDINYG